MDSLTQPDGLPVANTIGEAINHNARNCAHRGFIFQDTRGEESFLGFDAIADRTRQLACALHRRGWRAGQRAVVIAFTPRSFVLSFLAAIRLGVVPVPLYSPTQIMNSGLIQRSLAVARASGANWLVAPQHTLDAIDDSVAHEEGAPQRISEESLYETVGEDSVPLDQAGPDDVAYLQFTSGSTEAPRGVMLTHRNLFNNSIAIKERLQADPERDRGVSWLPLGHDMGLIGFVIAPIFWGGPTCVLIPTARFIRHPNCWMDAIDRHRGSITFAPPYALNTASRAARDRHREQWDLSCLHTLGIGGEPIQVNHLEQFDKTFGGACGLPPTAISPAYGLAEATLAVTIKDHDDRWRARPVDRVEFQQRRITAPIAGNPEPIVHVSCGTPLHGVDATIVDDHGKLLGEGQEGEIRVRSNALCQGYATPDGLSTECFVDDWLITGDRGYLLQGELYVTGRTKQLILIHGVNHYPQTIEWAVAESLELPPGTVAAFSRPGSRTEELVLALEIRKIDPEELTSRVRAVVKNTFALAVADVIMLNPGNLLRTPSGKLRRNEMRDHYLRSGGASIAERVIPS